MSLSPNLKTTFLYVASLSILSVLAFIILQGWYTSKNVGYYIEKEENLTQEISELELHIVDLSNSLAQKDKEILIRDQLIEEKNLELDFLDKEVDKWKGRYYQQKEQAEKESLETLVVSYLH